MLVSVIIPTYNRKAYVCQAIDSALAQTYADCEIIVVDDGSTDGTGKALQERYGERIRYIYQNNRGEAAARNEAIRHSRGQCIALLDSDDLWEPTKLEEQVELLKYRDEVGLVSCHALRIDADGNLVSTAPMYAGQVPDPIPLELLVLRSPLFASTVLVRRTCLDGVGGFLDEIRYGEDRDFFLRVAARCQVGFVHEPLVLMRRHLGNQSATLMPRDEVEHRLKDRLLVNEHAFQAFCGDAELLADLKAKAQAVEYARAAFATYRCGDFARGADLLSRAADLDQATWRSGEKVAEKILQHARMLLAASLGNPSEAIRFVESICGHLPASLKGWKTYFRRAVMGHLYIELAFLHRRQGESSLVRRYLLRGITSSPVWLGNRGVLSIGAEAFLGASVTGVLRRTFRRFKF